MGGAARDEWLNIQRRCFSSRLAREFSARDTVEKSHSNSSIRQRIGETCLSFERSVFAEGSYFWTWPFVVCGLTQIILGGREKKYITKHRIRQSAIPQSMTLSHVCERQPLCYRRGWGSKQRSAMIATSELISQLPLCRCSR